MRSIIISILLLASATANSALIDNESFTIDTTSGLDWLDLTATANMTMVDALAANSGWRLASNAEVEGLFNQIFVGYYDTNSSGASYSYEGAYADQYQDAQYFQSLFGVNFDTPDQQGVLGVYFDEDGIGRAIGAWLWTDGSRSDVWGLEYLGNYSSYYDSNSYFNHGILLVRTSVVPIPAAAWLFGSGLGLLGWIRCKATL